MSQSGLLNGLSRFGNMSKLQALSLFYRKKAKVSKGLDTF